MINKINSIAPEPVYIDDIKQVKLVEILIQRLTEMDINTTLHKLYGVYIIELDMNGYKRKQLEQILNIMNDSMSLVHYSQLSVALCINTNVNIL